MSYSLSKGNLLMTLQTRNHIKASLQSSIFSAFFAVAAGAGTWHAGTWIACCTNLLQSGPLPNPNEKQYDITKSSGINLEKNTR